MTGDHVRAISMATYQQELSCSLSLLCLTWVGQKHRFKSLFLFASPSPVLSFLLKTSAIAFRIWKKDTVFGNVMNVVDICEKNRLTCLLHPQLKSSSKVGLVSLQLHSASGLPHRLPLFITVTISNEYTSLSMMCSAGIAACYASGYRHAFLQ